MLAPRPRARQSIIRRRVLALLENAGSEGVSEHLLIAAYGFSLVQLAGLVRAGLASATPTSVNAGARGHLYCRVADHRCRAANAGEGKGMRRSIFGNPEHWHRRVRRLRGLCLNNSMILSRGRQCFASPRIMSTSRSMRGCEPTAAADDQPHSQTRLFLPPRRPVVGRGLRRARRWQGGRAHSPGEHLGPARATLGLVDHRHRARDAWLDERPCDNANRRWRSFGGRGNGRSRDYGKRFSGSPIKPEQQRHYSKRHSHHRDRSNMVLGEHRTPCGLLHQTVVEGHQSSIV
jgi:hypothetical protein